MLQVLGPLLIKESSLFLEGLRRRCNSKSSQGSPRIGRREKNCYYLAFGMKQRMSRAEGHPGDRNGVLPLAAQISRLLHVCSCPCCYLTMAKPGCHLLMTSVSLKPLLPCLNCPPSSLVAHASSAASPSEQIICKMDR